MKKFNNVEYKISRPEGITLISLIITIIILIILAGVGINLSLRSNGIFNRAKQAKHYYEVGVNDEHILISDINNAINEYTDHNKKDTYEMKIDTLSTSEDKCFTYIILDVKKYSKLTFGTLNMASTSYNRFYLFDGKYQDGEYKMIARMMSEINGENGIFENMEFNISEYDYITILIESGRGDKVYIKDITLK